MGCCRQWGDCKRRTDSLPARGDPFHNDCYGCIKLTCRDWGLQMSNELERLRKIAAENIRYERQLSRLHSTGKETSCIDQTITRALENITSIKARSFVIYGEPQSGKTEMMICLTAKLIDSGFNLIVHLLNDSVQLLQQNLERFQRSGLSPSARNFSEVMDPAVSLKVGQHVIFCKKNTHDLRKLTERLATVNIWSILS